MEEVSVDMWGGFPKVVMEVFPNAVILFDRFHVMKPVNEELNLIRKQTQIKERGSKFILLKNGENLSEEEKRKLEHVLSRSKALPGFWCTMYIVTLLTTDFTNGLSS